NNAIYGMTGGQMAPTTLLGQKTTTTPYGRAEANEGHPLRMVELLSALGAPVYLERVAATDSKHMNKARRAVRKAIQAQVDGKGFSMVELLSPCPTGWKIEPVKARQWVHEAMEPNFPLGVTKDRLSEIEAHPWSPREEIPPEKLWEALEVPVDEETAKPVEGMTHMEERFRHPRLKIAGFGGQGILLLGVALADCGMRGGYHVSWLPSYGPEMRGGTANCHVRVSTDPIGSPLVADSTVLVAMNRPSLERFEKDLVPGGVLIYDSTLIDIEPTRTDIQIIPIPATKLADELGQTRAANMVILGAYVALTNIFPLEHAIRTLPDFIKKEKMIPLNEKALRRGEQFMKEEYQPQ
ncbi:MAG: 2-ketoisovalerate ferredoxin oxidoreductase, partial [Candidatus Eisenbacteria bacterium]|nr:2-ketoisovalerate ferredoxin oxidoreductase [Candidatus Eisenbacteria bacterium]